MQRPRRGRRVVKGTRTHSTDLRTRIVDIHAHVTDIPARTADARHKLQTYDTHCRYTRNTPVLLAHVTETHTHIKDVQHT